MLSPDTVGAGATPLARNGDTTSKGSEGPKTTYGVSAIVRAASSVDDTSGMDDEGLDVRVTSSEDLASMESTASDDRSPLIVAWTPASVVR
jgi:hypothetical protein